MNWCVNHEKVEMISMRNVFNWIRIFAFMAILFQPIFAFAAPMVTDVVAK